MEKGQTRTGLPTTEEIQERVKEGAKALQQLLRQPGGEEALVYLEALFDGGSPFVAGDAYQTHMKIGEQNVVRYLRIVKESGVDYGVE